MKEPCHRGWYLGRHVHEVIEDQGRSFWGAPATPSQPVGGGHFSFPVLAVVFRAAGAGAREEQPAVQQLDVVQPGQQVGEHDLTPIGVRRGEPLAHLYREGQRWRATCYHIEINEDSNTPDRSHGAFSLQSIFRHNRILKLRLVLKSVTSHLVPCRGQQGHGGGSMPLVRAGGGRGLPSSKPRLQEEAR